MQIETNSTKTNMYNSKRENNLPAVLNTISGYQDQCQNLKNQMICIVGITMEQILPTQLWQKKVKDDTVNIDIQNTYNQLLTASYA